MTMSMTDQVSTLSIYRIERKTWCKNKLYPRHILEKQLSQSFAWREQKTCFRRIPSTWIVAKCMFSQEIERTILSSFTLVWYHRYVQSTKVYAIFIRIWCGRKSIHIELNFLLHNEKMMENECGLTKTTSTGGPVQSARPTPTWYEWTVAPYQPSEHNK